MALPPSSPAPRRRGLARLLGVGALAPNVFALGWVSLLTDFSSEMIYPLLPIFLATTLGASALAIGLIEGIAEATAALLKWVSGVWADRARRRKPLIFGGYTLSGAARPLIGLATVWPVVLLLRFCDRVGKGLRTSPRDALIADVSPPQLRGTAFGFHRAMDHAGAVAGPLAAALLIDAAGLQMRTIFLLAAIPAAQVVVIILWRVREPNASAKSAPAAPPASRPSLKLDLSPYPHSFKMLLLALVVFTLGNSSDAFLLLQVGAGPRGLHADRVALLWAGLHVVKMIATWAGGRLSDRLPRRRLLQLGWLWYAAIYLAFGWFDSPAALVAIFLAYGIYFGLTEPCEKAMVADYAPGALRATAFGAYHAATGLAALPASLLFGALWAWHGPALAFTVGAALALIAAALLWTSRPAEA